MPFADVDPARGDITLSAQWNEKELIKTIPGSSWDGHDKSWHLPLSWGSCVAMRGFFHDTLRIGDGLIAWANAYRTNRVDRVLPLRHRMDGIGPNEESLLDDTIKSWRNEAKVLYPFQENGVQFLCLAGDALLGDEMGAGKTPQTLSALRALDELPTVEALPALVICPNSVKRHWANTAGEWLPQATPYVVEGNIAQRRKVIAAAHDDKSALVIINIEALRQFSRLAPFGSVRLKKCTACSPHGDPDLKTASCETHLKEFNGFGFRTIICDEAHRAKDPKSKQTRALWSIMHDPSVQRRWALTGTPIAQHVGDLWAIMHAIAPYDFPTKSKFVERYALTSWNAFGGLDIVGVNPEHREELFGFLDPHFRRMTKALVLRQLPPKVRETRYVEMTPSQKKMYKEMERDLVTFTDEDEMIMTPSQLSAQIRLAQLAAASVTVDKPDPDDPKTWKVTLKNPSPKLDEFEAVLDDLGDAPCVVAAEHKQLINLAAERLTKLKIPHALITGDVSDFERNRALTLLRENKIRVLLFTAKAGGTGLDMSAADTIIMLQRPWSMVDNLQAEDRVHRIGSERHQAIRVIDIITRDTVEEKQVERLYIKLARLEEITRDRAAMIAAGLDPAGLDAEEAKIMGEFLGLPIETNEDV